MNQYHYVPIENLTAEPESDGSYRLIANCHWLVHPEKGLKFYLVPGLGKFLSPGCNFHRSIVEKLLDDEHEIVFIPKVWIPDDQDY